MTTASLLIVLLSSGPPLLQASTPQCIALMLPSVRGADGDATSTATSLRALLSSYLAGPRLRVMDLDARVTVQATEEAREKQCPPVLVVTLTRKRGGENGVGKALGRAASGAAWYVPYGGSGATAVARGAAIAGAHAVSELAGSTRARDEMTIECSIARPGGASTPIKRETLKAKADGEDLVTPLVERVAEAVVVAMVK